MNVETDSAVKRICIAQAFNTILYAPLYLAIDLGFFADEGLDVSLLTAHGDQQAFDALVTNQAQFAVGDPAFVALSSDPEKQGQVVLPILNGVCLVGVAKEASIPQIRRPADLRGYSVATFPEPSTAYVLQKHMFQVGGVKPNIVETDFNHMLEALDTGAADIALILEPDLTEAERRGYRVVFTMADQYPNFALTGLTALTGYLELHPEIVHKVVRAFTRAAQYLYTSTPTEVASQLGARFATIDLQTRTKIIRTYTKSKLFARDLQIEKSGWSSSIRVRLDTGSVENIDLYKRYAERAYITGVSAHNIQKQFLHSGVTLTVLGGVSINARAGEVVSILGRSGHGKSTFFNILSSLESLTEGNVFLRGSVGYATQKPLLLPWRTLLKNVLIPVEITASVTNSTVTDAMRELDRVGLGAQAQYFPEQLSGGMLQKAAFVRLIIQDPDIILLDEPFSAVDYLDRIVLMQFVRQYAREQKKVVLMVSHNIEEAITVSDKIAVFSDRPARIVHQAVVAIPEEERDVRTIVRNADFLDHMSAILDAMKVS